MKKGFTLIELLAVIVILAIIALIATPIVLGIIEDSKESSSIRSAEYYLDAVEQAVAIYQLNNKVITNGVYSIMENGDICLESYKDKNCKDTDGNANNNVLEVDVSGDIPNIGTIEITDGKIGDISLKYTDGKTVVKSLDDKIIYFPKLKDVCKPVKNSTVGVVATSRDDYSTNKYKAGDEYTCELGDGVERTFFILETGDTSTLTDDTGRIAQEGQVSLIMNANINSDKQAVVVVEEGSNNGTVAWIKEEDYPGDNWSSNEDNNVFGPITAAKYLKEATSNWTKLAESQITLPTAAQVSQADENTFTNSSASGSYSLNSGWLKTNIYSTASDDTKKLPIGYWTSTPTATYAFGAWLVGYFGQVDEDGLLQDYAVFSTTASGVRPVITLEI